MPGISLIKGNFVGDISQGNDASAETRYLDALRSIMHNESYSLKVLLKYDSVLVACTKYPEYPIAIYEDDQFWVCVEGKIYGQTEATIKGEINILLNGILDSQEIRENDEIIDRWLSSTDGEFIIYALSKKSKELIIFNDILGRLPLYYYADKSRVIISRELHLVSYLVWYHDNARDTKDEYRFDKLAIAEYILFGHTLDKKMLQKGIYRMQPGSIIRVFDLAKSQDQNSGHENLKIESLYSFNFEQRKFANESLKENTNKISRLFSKACIDRMAHNGSNVISLSGGFDSRIVAACFHKNKLPCMTVTYREPNWKPILGNRTEEEIAKKLSGMLGVEWENYPSDDTTANDLVTLLELKGGTNYLGLGFMLPFLEYLTKRHGSESVFFTGDGGCRVFVNLGPPKKLKNMEDLINYILERFTFVSLSEVCRVVQIKEEVITKELERILSSYPEKNLDRKFVHFIFHGSAFKQLFEAEDRNRFYLWSTSPFYSIPLFNYVMNCSDDNKVSRALHREILCAFSPSAAAVENSDYGCSILSFKFKAIVPILKTTALRYQFLRRIARWKVSTKGGSVFDNRMIKCVLTQLGNCSYLDRYLSTERLAEMIKNRTEYGYHGIYYLFTIMSLIELAHSDDSSIEKFYC
jgi:asparagine synthase (glutamine-hydrolysing)